MKRCKVCGVEKPFGSFYRAVGMRDGYRNDCKQCHLAAAKRRYDADPRPARERAKKWNRANPERVKERMDEYRASGKKAASDRASHLKRKFGMTRTEYDLMLAHQSGGCAICGRPPRPDISLHVDHDHRTGRVRGLCCFPCNNAIGLLQEEPELARALADYLDDRHRQLARERLRALRVGA